MIRYYKPTPKVLFRQASAAGWFRQKKLGLLKDKREIISNYVLFKLNPDVYDLNPNMLPGERGELLPGDPLYKPPITEEVV